MTSASISDLRYVITDLSLEVDDLDHDDSHKVQVYRRVIDHLRQEVERRHRRSHQRQQLRRYRELSVQVANRLSCAQDDPRVQVVTDQLVRRLDDRASG